MGILLYFISNLFLNYDSFLECSVNFILKNIGISLILFINYINIAIAYKLGIKKNETDVRFRFKDEENPKNNLYSDSEDNSKENYSDEDNETKYLSMISKKSTLIKTNTDEKNSSSFYLEDIERNCYSKIISTQQHLRKTIIFYSFYIFIVFLTVIIVYVKKHRNINKENFMVLSNNGEWFFYCRLERSNLIFNMAYILSFVFLRSFGRMVSYHEYIFKYITYISYSGFIFLATGPIINVFSYIIFKDNRTEKIFLDTIFNTICYFTLFLIYSWDKIYYTTICKNKNESNFYFIYKIHELCQVHNSTSCGCKLNMTKEYVLYNIDNYISIYKICSNFYKKYSIKE
eukprot:jgi/Orpsp1_1/1189578/evm.model.d7180000073013.1